MRPYGALALQPGTTQVAEVGATRPADDMVVGSLFLVARVTLRALAYPQHHTGGPVAPPRSSWRPQSPLRAAVAVAVAVAVILIVIVVHQLPILIVVIFIVVVVFELGVPTDDGAAKGTTWVVEASHHSVPPLNLLHVKEVAVGIVGEVLVPADWLEALPAEVGVALLALHLVAPLRLVNGHTARRALSGLPLNGLEALGLLL
mmetsp:Transcript_37528/g.94139  ORF Transcript_37528/g.94139 Transcript_37528/m.94139 type:complete len:203 (-) Transcript_37528:652-1260(-)